MSDTPETDELILSKNGFGATDYEWREYSRQLERERDEAREDAVLPAPGPMTSLELRTTEELARMERKRDEWRKCAEKLAAIIGAPDKCTWATDDEINEAWSVFAKLKEDAK